MLLHEGDSASVGLTGADGRARVTARSQVVDGDFTTPEKVFALSTMPWSEIQAKHPFLSGVVDEKMALAARGARDLAREALGKLGYVEGRDYLCAS